MSLHRSAGRPHAAGLALATALVVGSAVAVPAAAQDGGRGFLFREPGVSLSLRGGFAHAQGGGQLIEETTQLLTLDKGDLGSGMVAADLGFRLHSRVDFLVGGAWARAKVGTEYRRWFGDDDLPVTQTTEFTRVPVTASLKLYLTDRGRSVGQFAWVPARYAPYVGVGGGRTWYRFRQNGEFVDNPFDMTAGHAVYRDEQETSGWTSTAHAMAGVEMGLTNHVGLTAEARYGYGKAEVGRDYVGYDRIDLSGATATVGIFFRF